MKQVIQSAVFALVTIAPTILGFGVTTAAAQSFQIQEFDSPDGHSIWLVEDHSNPIVSIEFNFQHGSFSDPEARAWARLGIEDPHQVLGENATKNPGKATTGTRRLPPTERRAIEILEAKDNWSKAEVRKAYKSLIKILHPDMNGGDRSQEEQLQEVVWAWDQIKDSRSFK